VERFEVPAREAIEALRRAEPDFLVSWPQTHGPVRLEERVRIVLLVSVAHLWTSCVRRADHRFCQVAALRETVALRAELAPPVDFIEAPPAVGCQPIAGAPLKFTAC
jgi:hypothetical protein